MDDPFLSFVAVTLMGGLLVIGVLGYLAALVGIVWWIDQKLPDHYPDWAAPALFFGVWDISAIFYLPSHFFGTSMSIGISVVFGLFVWWQLKTMKRKAALATED